MTEKKKQINWTKVRGFFAAMFALALVVVMAAVGAKLAGWRVPGLIQITDFLGIENDQPPAGIAQP